MIDRVARAICKANFLNGGNEDDDGWDDCPEATRQRYLSDARAAIEAMRPDAVMIRKAVWAYEREITKAVDAGLSQEGLSEARVGAIEAALAAALSSPAEDISK